MKNLIRKASQPDVGRLLEETLQKLMVSIRSQMQFYHPAFSNALTFRENLQAALDSIQRESGTVLSLDCADTVFMMTSPLAAVPVPGRVRRSGDPGAPGPALHGIQRMIWAASRPAETCRLPAGVQRTQDARHRAIIRDRSIKNNGNLENLLRLCYNGGNLKRGRFPC